MKARYLGKYLYWAIYTLIIWVALYPILTTTVVADDLVLPFNQFLMAGPGLADIFRLGVNGASAGHFNYLGQLFGVVIGWLWLHLPGQFGFRMSFVYATTKFIVFFSVITAAAALIREIVTISGGQISHWESRIYLALVFVGTLQLHLVWSNDPVASYPMSGYSSVILATWALVATLRTLRQPTMLRISSTSVLIMAAILYYEMNVALIPTVLASSLFFSFFSETKNRTNVRKTIYTGGLMLLLPTLVTFYLQKRNAPVALYSGVAVDINGPIFGPFFRSLASSLPASSWHLAFQWMPSSYPLYPSVVISLTFLALASWSWFRLSPQKTPGDSRMQLVPTLTILGLVSSYWFGTTMIQALTAKVQTEATQIGHVYNFYAPGSVCVAIIIVVLGKLLSSRASGRKVLCFLAPILVVFSCYQYGLNAAIQKRHYSFTGQNRNLLVAFTADWNLEARCHSLREWQALAWPDYYRTGMSAGMEKAYKYFHGDNFCDG